MTKTATERRTRSASAPGRALIAACAVLALTWLSASCGFKQVEPPDSQRVPIAPVEQAARGTRQIGQPCARHQECVEGLDCDAAYEPGQCRPATCEASCEEAGGACVTIGAGAPQCWPRCDHVEAIDDEAFVCERVIDLFGEQTEVVVPRGAMAEAELVDFEELAELLGVTCASELGPQKAAPWRALEGATREFAFELEPEDASFMIVNAVASGQDSLYPAELLTPDGQSLDLVYDYHHHNARLGDLERERVEGVARYDELSLDWSILFPYAASRLDLIAPGRYTYRAFSSTEELCFYVLKESQQERARLDINFYFTDYEGFNAVHASGDEDFQEVIERVALIYAQRGVEIGRVRYTTLPKEVGDRYVVVRDFEEIAPLTALGHAPPGGLRGALSVDVFLVDAITAEEGNLLGVAGGIPGAPGMHGNLRNGVLFSLTDLGSHNHVVAHVMAHEIAHYLGLRHTTEFVVATEFEEDFELVLGARDMHEDTP